MDDYMTERELRELVHDLDSDEIDGFFEDESECEKCGCHYQSSYFGCPNEECELNRIEI